MKKTLLASAISLSLVTLPVQVLAFTPIVEGITVNNEVVDNGGQIVRNGGVINNGVVSKSMIIVTNGSSAGTANNTTVDDGGWLQVTNAVVTGTVVNQGGLLEVKTAGIATDSQINDGGYMSLGLNSQSKGYLNIAAGTELFITNNDTYTSDVTTNNPAQPANVTIENLNVAGLVDLGPSWVGASVVPVSPPEVLGPVLVTRINNVTMQGGDINLLPYSAGGQFNRLEIENLAGQGNFAMTTQLASNAGDFITVSQQATGNFGITVQDSGKEPQSANSLALVHINRGDAQFRLLNAGGVVDLGVYQYGLYSQENNGSTDWYLATKAADLPGITPNRPNTAIPVLSAAAQGVLNMAAAPRHILNAELSTLRQRQGELKTDADGTVGVWARYLTDNSRLSDNKNVAFKNTLNGMEIGADKLLGLSQGNVLIGAFTGYSSSDVKSTHRADAKGDIRSYSGGLYLTYLDKSGLYVDTVLKANRFNNELSTQSARAEYSQNALSASLESGYQLPVYTNLVLEPYGKVSYSRIGRADYTLSNGMAADVAKADSVQGELGTILAASYTVNQMTVNPYVKLAIAREFIKTNTVAINGIGFDNNFSGNVGKYGVGVDTTVASNTSIFAEVNYLNGSKIETPITANIGFRLWF
ncbi:MULTISPECIES: autotransporter outer membrane beta-barrel domain-containing protein [Yersinia]|jgi:outer membrane autotransporter protein|uniref:autotransporter outer membrane beta-barrel domain-containing protein n=1 Tax=Yersinia TaxID=629 RepID=UPI0009B6FF91|nr:MULTISPECIES: autotransporter outer membrane beta-barrel domain-containing protein [Yersinia]ARB82722.1 autotransporter outer membrane beta-barrel domain-containing protein [Yersinia sp. FDAARGOS_228]AVL36455.1 autotransporter outer membrane beta-barrel domain-containing protein [Yersinia intermedia]